MLPQNSHIKLYMARQDRDELLEAVVSRLLAGETVLLRPRGTSMLPFIKDGKERLRLKRMESVAVGDIVLAKASNTPNAALCAREWNYVIHRVIKSKNGLLTLMGDANIKREYCTFANVIATAIEIVGEDGNSYLPKPRRLWVALRPLRRPLNLLCKIIGKWD